MATYHPPIRDMQFVLHEVLDAQSVRSPAFPGSRRPAPTSSMRCWKKAERSARASCFPTNRTGDEQGAKFDAGSVTTPDGFKEAYETLREAGWLSLGCDPDYGGQGLPHTLNVFFEEMLQSANMSFALYPG